MLLSTEVLISIPPDMLNVLKQDPQPLGFLGATSVRY